MEKIVNRIKAFLDPHASISNEFWKRYAHHIEIVEVPNKTVVKKAGVKETELRFILEGAGAILLERAEDKEMCIDICFRDHFFCDFNSLNNGKPSNLYIRNFYKMKMAVISKEAINEILDASVEAHYLSTKLVQIQSLRTQNYIENMGKGSLERYYALRAQYGKNFNRIPLSLVASYLNVTKEWISRIRARRE